MSSVEGGGAATTPIAPAANASVSTGDRMTSSTNEARAAEVTGIKLNFATGKEKEDVGIFQSAAEENRSTVEAGGSTDLDTTLDGFHCSADEHADDASVSASASVDNTKWKDMEIVDEE